MELEAFLEAINSGGIVLLALTGIWAFVKGWIVPKPTVDEIKKDRDEWRDLALVNMDLTQRAVNVADTVVPNGGRTKRRLRRM